MDCPTGKACHSSKENADRHITSLSVQGRTQPLEMNSYHCLRCGFWHIGHQKKVTIARAMKRQRKGYPQ